MFAASGLLTPPGNEANILHVGINRTGTDKMELAVTCMHAQIFGYKYNFGNFPLVRDGKA